MFLIEEGTSVSTPTFAGIITLVNDVRALAGKPALGFLNPWLYSIGQQALNDIVNGSSYGCGTGEVSTLNSEKLGS